MTRIQKLDVTIEADVRELEALGKDDAVRALIEKLRMKADEAAESVRGRLRTDMQPELTFSKGTNVFTGQECLLVGSRWSVEVPESFQVA